MKGVIKSFILETAEVFLIALAIVLPIRYFLIQPFFVKGQSMEPNFYDGDYLIIDELSYRFRAPERGEVIVFKSPDLKSYYIKRVIGLPNETISLENEVLTVSQGDEQNGKKISETYLAPDEKTQGNLKITLKLNEYFVLGDNRHLSYDSRNWGPMSRDKITGRVLLRLFPFNKASAFNAPTYEPAL